MNAITTFHAGRGSDFHGAEACLIDSGPLHRDCNIDDTCMYMHYLLLADAILVTHAAFVAFVVLGLVLIVAGGMFSWSWVRHRGFRIAHLAGIGIVVLQSWFGMICPLTT